MISLADGLRERSDLVASFFYALSLRGRPRCSGQVTPRLIGRQVSKRSLLEPAATCNHCQVECSQMQSIYSLTQESGFMFQTRKMFLYLKQEFDF